MNRTLFLNHTQVQAVVAIVWIFFAILLGVLAHRLLYWFLKRWAQRSHNAFATAVVRRTSRPAAYIYPLLAILAIFPNLNLPERWSSTTVHVTGLLTIGAIAWTIIATIRLWGDVALAQHRVDVEDNLLARQLGTRVAILSRVAITMVILISVGMMLMTFPSIQHVGATLLASAGVAGIVAGLAARPLFENLVAGVQLALTQPIRVDDVVIVEKQYGRIEEIHSTYVVVQIWDLRRLVVPLTYFLTTPFENWTRRTANLMGDVTLFADWTLDVAALRAEIPKIVERTPLWDKEFQNLQVTDVTERAVQIRALVTARNSSELFDLRCFVREAIVAYIRDNQPHAFPRLRVEVPIDAAGENPGAGKDRPSVQDERLAAATALADGRILPPDAR